MDRPEDFEPNHVNGRVYLVLTKNSKRKPEQVNAANTRAKNTTGHILELLPPGEGKDADHAAAQFKWDVFILAGDPTAADQGAKYGEGISANGWFANPDNIAFDPQGRLWIATDGAPDFGIADGLYATEIDGPGRAVPKLMYAVPMNAEMCGPCFTPDGQTLFVAVQHPAEKSETPGESHDPLARLRREGAAPPVGRRHHPRRRRRNRDLKRRSAATPLGRDNRLQNGRRRGAAYIVLARATS
jgi:secreted PhoX family phosphatase